MRNAVMHSATCAEQCHLGYYGSLHECPYKNCPYYEGRLDGLLFDN